MKTIIGLFMIIACCGCIDTGVHSPGERVWLIQEVQLNDTASFFWFTIDNGARSQNSNYFQVASNRCALSAEAAQFKCEAASQIYDVKKDTIRLLAYFPIEVLKPSPVTVIQVKYNHELFDLKKKPNLSKQYFVDTYCK